MSGSGDVHPSRAGRRVSQPEHLTNRDPGHFIHCDSACPCQVLDFWKRDHVLTGTLDADESLVGPDGRRWIEKAATVGKTLAKWMQRWTPSVVFI